MKIISTHINADFDGFAAMVGLLKLHPDAYLVFPGAKEPPLRHFFRENRDEFPELPFKETRDVTHLILVDVGREDRLGPLTELLREPGRPFVEIYDHHPQEQISIQADRLHVCAYGSTTTIVVHELMKAKAPLTSFESSIMLAGIYEDTANFLSTGCTPEDFEAALYLLNAGAEIALVNRLLTHRLQPDQAAFFNTMVSNSEQITLDGSTVVLSVFSWPSFVPEAAYLVHRFMDLEPIDLFFALISMENRVHVIARSVSPAVDVGQLMIQLGGGGHKMAASAVLKGVTLIEAREKLIALLNQNLQRRERAVDLMKTNVIQIAPEKQMNEASELMNRYRINALVIADHNRTVGTITRQIVDGGIFHGLGDRPVQDYMLTEIPLIDPDTPAPEILDRMMSGRTRFVLVGKDVSDIKGIITRMDLLRFQYELSSPQLALRKSKRSENLNAMLNKRLPDSVIRLLRESGSVAEEMGYKIFLVGGMVRDLLLHRENIDLDLVVEGDGIEFAERFAKSHSAEIATHKQFGTARILFEDGLKMDVATARTESYHAPAALPEVLGGILRQDLYRRDFTINTLAIDLMPERFGALIDHFGGWEDLHRGSIRVLHSLSFIDDPTRALRAVRFATRFNFTISKDTDRLIRSAVESRVLDKLSGKRLWTELKNVLQEEHPIPAIRLLHEYKLLQFIHPSVVLDSFLLDLLYQVQNVLSWFRLNFLNQEQPEAWMLYLLALLEKLDRQERIAVSSRLQLTARVQEILKYYKSNTKDIRARLLSRAEPIAADIYFSLHEFHQEVILYAMARSTEDSMRQQILAFFQNYRTKKLAITGDDIRQFGVQPGPEIKDILDSVLRAHLNGLAPDRETQLELAERIVKDRSRVTGTS
jgi:tRNA nucleotidyltransferase (CCA-adding enzyme)